MVDGMTEQGELTIGEIGRAVARIELSVAHLSNQMQTSIAPVSELKVRVDRCEADINGLGEKLDAVNTKVDAVKTRADRTAGGIAALAFVAGMIPWPWKR